MPLRLLMWLIHINQKSWLLLAQSCLLVSINSRHCSLQYNRKILFRCCILQYNIKNWSLRIDNVVVAMHFIVGTLRFWDSHLLHFNAALNILLVVAWCCLALLHHNQPFLLLLLAIRHTTYAHGRHCGNWQHVKIWLLCPCVLRWLAYCRHMLLAVRLLCNIKNMIAVTFLAIWHINMLVIIVASGDWQYKCYIVVRSSYPCNSLHLAMFKIVCIVVHSLAIWRKKMKLSLLAHCDTTWKIRLSFLSLLAINSSHIAMASCLRPSLRYDEKGINVIASYNTTKICSREQRRKSPTIAWKQSHKPMTLHVAGIFDIIFLGKHFKTISMRQSRSRGKLKGIKLVR